jgi:DNA recombination protein RmuC
MDILNNLNQENILLIILLIIAIAIFILLFFISVKLLKRKESHKEDNQSFILLQNQINEITKMLDRKMGESKEEFKSAVQTQFSESQKLIKDITQQVSQVQESNKQVFNIAEQLQNLEKVLKNQKQRGNLGERGLELVLSNILPPTAYKLQYLFRNGSIVDAIIKTKEGIIPVDAKFSLDNYQRLIDEKDDEKREILEKEFKNDLKKRIDETAKYIKQEEGTTSFAFMFIPAEGIYYDLLVNEIGAVKTNTRNLIDYAHKDKNVIIVSPTTFAAFLQTILYGFHAFKIEERTKEIQKNVEALKRHFKSYEEMTRKLGNNLTTTTNSYNMLFKELNKTGKDFNKITEGDKLEIDVLSIDKPNMEE